MLEVKKGIKLRGNVASVIASLEKRQNNTVKNYKITKMKDITAKEDSKEKEENKENIKVLDKESESDSEKEHVYELEEINNTQLNTIREERETASEASNNKTSKGADDSNSSPEESTIKHTWSGSGSPAVLSSGSDFSSSEEEENPGENKRNSMTKDCNSDFHWVVSDKQAETKTLFEKKEEPKKYSNFYDDLKIEENKKPEGDSNPFFSMDRNRKMIFEFSDPKPDHLVQLRLPPMSPGSLDRKKISKSRSERDSKCKSSVITRPRKSPAKVLPEDYSFQFSKIHDYCHEDSEPKYCQHYRNKYPECSCHSPHYDYHHHYHHRCYSPCRNYYGSCESIGDKSSRKNSFGSQKNLMKICDVYDDRRSPRKNNWQSSQNKLYQGSNECLCHNRSCQLDREKSQSWRLLGNKSVPELEDRIIRLENDKESLQLQVTVLTEQVEAQSEKISDLQQSLEDKKQQLNSADDLLQREMLTRSSLETQKLELMSAISELKLQHAALERENYELKEEKKRYQSIKPPMMPRNTSPALLQNTPLGANRYSPNDYGSRKSGNPFSNQDIYHSDPSSQSNPFAESHQRYIPSSTPNNNVNSVIGSPSPSPVITLSQRREDLKYSSMTPQPNIRRGMDQYNSLPRQKLIESDQLSHMVDVHRKGVAFGKGKTSLITLKSEKSYSAPNLAETERLSVRSDQVDFKTDSEFQTTHPVEVTQTHASSKKGIKKIFNKIKRSNSGNVNDLLGDGEFRRGGIRATAGPRLGGPIIHIHITPDKPFAEWETEYVCNWLEDIGLENYVADLRRWIKNGSQLLAASAHDLEKELQMKNPLHKKKLMLALQEISDKNQGADELLKPAGCLDTHWVLRWLDDVGLPQHKEVFLTARIDGRMLHRLTMDDLSVLHITSQLHVASLKRGIKVLRDHKWDPNCLTRRSVPDEPPPTFSDVTLWTNHRVMEWLRIVDLAEYAPNLRGSGVHGALMVYEPKFTAELLASLLSIPPNKTLLRRHLSTHFKELLGREIIQAKREAESTLGYIPLTPSAKVKTIKKPQFTLKRKKSKNEFDYGDLVCPLEDGTSGEQSTPSNNSMGVNGDGMMKEKRHVPDVCPVTDPSPRDSPLSDRLSRV